MGHSTVSFFYSLHRVFFLTGGKSDRTDDIEEERDDNGGDDTEDSKTRTTRMTRSMGRGDKLLTCQGEENPYMMFTKVLIHEDLIQRALHVDLQYLIPCKTYRLSTIIDKLLLISTQY